MKFIGGKQLKREKEILKKLKKLADQELNRNEELEEKKRLIN